MPQDDLKEYQKRAEFDRNMTAATVYRQRGDYANAGESIYRALELYPADPKAREFAADLLFARGELEKAAAEYKRLFSEDKSRASAEAKYAKAMVAIAEGQRQQDLLQQMLDQPEKFRDTSRSPLLAALVSIAPGFGQIYCGQLIKGIVLCCATIILWFFFYLTLPDVSMYPTQAQKLEMFARNMDPLAVVFGLAGLFLHMYAMVDAPVYASKMREKQAGKLAEPE